MPRAPLPSLQSALDYGGVSKAQIARDAGCSTWTLYTWLDGRAEVPKAKRARLARAMGGEVDWDAYAQELEAARQEAQGLDQEPPKAKAAGTAPRPRQEPAQGDPLAGAWGAGPKPAQAAPRPRMAPPKAPRKVKAPAAHKAPAQAAPAKAGGWLSNLFKDDGEDPFA